MANIDGYFGELGLEMKAIADYFGIDLGIIVTLNLSYELRKVCCSYNIKKKIRPIAIVYSIGKGLGEGV